MAKNSMNNSGGRVNVPTTKLPEPKNNTSMPKGQSKELPKGKYPNAGKMNASNC